MFKQWLHGVNFYCSRRDWKMDASLEQRKLEWLKVILTFDTNADSISTRVMTTTDQCICVVEKCQSKGFGWQKFILTDKCLIFVLPILLFGLTNFKNHFKWLAYQESWFFDITGRVQGSKFTLWNSQNASWNSVLRVENIGTRKKLRVISGQVTVFAQWKM